MMKGLNCNFKGPIVMLQNFKGLFVMILIKLYKTLAQSSKESN